MQPIGGPHLLLAAARQRLHEVVLEPDGESATLYGVLVGGTRYVVKVQDERSRRLALADRTLRRPKASWRSRPPSPAWWSR